MRLLIKQLTLLNLIMIKFCIHNNVKSFKLSLNDKIIALNVLKSFFLFLTLRLVLKLNYLL